METTSINYFNTLGEGLYAQHYSFIYVTCLFEHITDCLGLGFLGCFFLNILKHLWSCSLTYLYWNVLTKITLSD